MGANTGIEWTDSTWSPIRALNRATGKVGWHCEHMSEGCRFCYAEGINRRLGTGLDFKPGHRADVEILLDEKMLLAPLRWKAPRRIFLNSMTDSFAEFVKDEWIDRMFAVMALTRRHTFQVLTKRPARMLAAIKRMGKSIEILECQARSFGYSLKFNGYGLVPWPLPNVWLGTSAEDQATADERIPLLLETPAAVRFVSLEPLLGPIDLTNLQGCAFDALYGVREMKINWVIVGGESGKSARPMHPQWARDLRDQCAAAGVPFFFKQWGDHGPNPHLMGIQCRMSKKAAGRLLDGIEHNGLPT